MKARDSIPGRGHRLSDGAEPGNRDSLVCKERSTATEEQKTSLKWRLGQVPEANAKQERGAEWNGEPRNGLEQDSVMSRAVLLQKDEDGGVQRGDWLGRGWRSGSCISSKAQSPDGTCVSHCSSPLGTRHGVGHRVSVQQIVTELHRTQRHFIICFMVGADWEGKYSQLQFQKLLNEEPKPNIPPGTGGQNLDNL